MRPLLYHFDRLTANREYWYASEYLSVVALWREMYTLRFASIKYNFNRFCMIHLCDGQSDRRTDGRAIAYSALCIYAVAR